MPYEFKIKRRVEFSDTDMEGIMHFSNFFRFMETAEHGFFRSLGFSAVLSKHGLNVCLPRVHAECDYQAPLRFEDEVLIHMLVERKGSRSLIYEFRFHRISGSTLHAVARGKVTAVCAARQPDGSFKAVTLPEAIARRIEEAPSQGKSAPATVPSQAASEEKIQPVASPAGARSKGRRSPKSSKSERERNGGRGGAQTRSKQI
jgi:acyl-CoA thioester hydrolase